MTFNGSHGVIKVKIKSMLHIYILPLHAYDCYQVKRQGWAVLEEMGPQSGTHQEIIAVRDGQTQWLLHVYGHPSGHITKSTVFKL